jgi:hypothetical protein
MKEKQKQKQKKQEDRVQSADLRVDSSEEKKRKGALKGGLEVDLGRLARSSVVP